MGTVQTVLAPGDLLGDRYRLDEFLASGGMGQVWRATDTVLDRTVAVKVLLPALLSEPGFEARFREEARIIAALRHPGVVDVYDYGESSEPDGRRTLYLVMAYVDGEPLSHRLANAGGLSVAETMSVVAQAASALSAAHKRGIVHRDVKPGNLLIQPDGALTLVDFGVARSAATTAATTGNTVAGTALYMAPEQAVGKPVSAASDIYALGVVAYHCLAGQPPFSGASPVEVALKHLQDEPPPLPGGVPAPARALVERAMAKDPSERFPSAAVLAAAARAVEADSADPGGPTGTAGTGSASSAGASGAAAAMGASGATGSAGPAGSVRAAAPVGSASGPGALGSSPLGSSPVGSLRLEPVTTPDLMPVDVAPSDSEQPERLGSRRATIAGVSVAAAVVIGAFVALLRLSPAADPAAPPSTSTASSALAVPGVTPTSRRVTSTSRSPSPTPSASPAPSATPEESATPTGEPTRSAPVKTKPPLEPSAIVSISRSPTPGQSRQP